MKLLLYAAIFCFLISLITADEEEEEADGGSEAESGTEATASKQNGEKARSEPQESDNKQKSGKKPELQRGVLRRECRQYQIACVSHSKVMVACHSTAPNVMIKMVRFTYETEVKGTPPSKPGPSLTKGGKGLRGRCRIQEPNINCVGNSALVMWYYDGETCVPKNLGGCKLRNKQHGYLLCGRCAHRCMGIPFTSPRITKVCKRKA
ncbi:hypothetical protein MTO96_015859 [Rhipicephalus appendiculatus]